MKSRHADDRLRTEYVIVFGSHSGSTFAFCFISSNTSRAFSHWGPSADMRACDPGSPSADVLCPPTGGACDDAAKGMAACAPYRVCEEVRP